MSYASSRGRFAGSGIGVNGDPKALTSYLVNGNAYGGGRYNGATNIAVIDQQPSLTERWEVLGFNVTFAGMIRLSSTDPVPACGRVGDIWAGLIKGGQPFPGFPGFVNPAQPFPADLSTMVKIWDGDTDQPFVTYDVQGVWPPGQSLNLVAGGLQLPQPLIIDAGEQLAIGLWHLPSILAHVVGVDILDANYSVYYNIVDAAHSLV